MGPHPQPICFKGSKNALLGTMRHVTFCPVMNLHNDWGEAHFASPSHWPAQRDEADVTAMRNGRTILPSPNKRLARELSRPIARRDEVR